MSASDAIHPEQLALFSAAKFRGTRSSKPPQQSLAQAVSKPARRDFELTPTTMPAPPDRMASPLEHPHNQMQLLINPTEHIKRITNSTDLTSHYYGLPYGPNDSHPDDLMRRREADKATATPRGKAPNKAMSGLWTAKEKEAKMPEAQGGHGAGLYDRLKGGEQVYNPIQINMNDIADPGKDLQYEGHHRVAAGAALERERGAKGKGSVWMPVSYTGHIGGKNGTHNLSAGERAEWQAPEAQARRLLSKQARQARRNMNDRA